MTHPPAPWSASETAALRIALHIDGKTYAEAAAVLGRSYNSVRQKTKALGWQAWDARRGNGGNISSRERASWWYDRASRLRSAVAAGYKYSVIAAMLGVSKSAIAGKVYRLGLNRRPLRLYVTPRYAFNEIGPRDCCWPFGDPDRADFRFCGRDAMECRPYCAEHMALAYLPPR